MKYRDANILAYALPFHDQRIGFRCIILSSDKSVARQRLMNVMNFETTYSAVCIQERELIH
jgi:hypothetical protein